MKIGELTDEYEPGNPAFTDIDRSAGGRSGIVEWQIPDHDYDVIAYDLYYADDNGILGGDVYRVYRAGYYPLPETFSHPLRDIPADAVRLAVVPILQDSTEDYYYAAAFDVPLEDRVAAGLDRLYVNGDEVFPNPDDATRYEVIVPRDEDMAEIKVIAEGGAVYFGDLDEPDSDGETVIELGDAPVVVKIRVHTPGTEWTEEYELTIRREPFPDEPKTLVNDVRFGRLVEAGDEYAYRFVTKGMTAGDLKEMFLTDSDVSIVIRSEEEQPVPDGEEVPAGATVYLSREAEFQVIQLQWLSDYLRGELDIGESEPITLSNVALFVVKNRNDVTGDDEFDKEDMRLLLREIH